MQVKFEPIQLRLYGSYTTRCLILGVGFRGPAIQWRHSRDQGSKRRCHCYQFWDYISC